MNIFTHKRTENESKKKPYLHKLLINIHLQYTARF